MTVLNFSMASKNFGALQANSPVRFVVNGFVTSLEAQNEYDGNLLLWDFVSDVDQAVHFVEQTVFDLNFTPGGVQKLPMINQGSVLNLEQLSAALEYFLHDLEKLRSKSSQQGSDFIFKLGLTKEAVIAGNHRPLTYNLGEDFHNEFNWLINKKNRSVYLALNYWPTDISFGSVQDLNTYIELLTADRDREIERIAINYERVSGEKVRYVETLHERLLSTLGCFELNFHLSGLAFKAVPNDLDKRCISPKLLKGNKQLYASRST